MAVATKYRIETSSEAFTSMKVDIEFEGYAGSVIELKPTYDSAISLEYSTSSDNKTSPIMASRVTVNFFAQTDFQTLDISEANERQVRLSLYDNANTLVWRGWVNPASYSENYAAPPYTVTVVAECGLDSLSKIPFDLSDIAEGTTASEFQILREALFTEIALPFAESINIYDTSMSNGNANSPLPQGIIDYRSFGEKPSCQDVIVGILEPFGARIKLSRGKWVIENIQEKRSSYIVREYNASGVYQSNASFNPLITLDSGVNFRQILNTLGSLSTFPALRDAAVFFKSNPASTVLRGFSNNDDWTNATTLADWTANGITPAKTPVYLDGIVNEFGALLSGRDTSYNPDANYIESIAVAVALGKDIEITFSFFANWPAILIVGSSPSFWVQFILEGTTDTYYWNKNGTWQTSKTAVDIKPGTRKKWYRNQQLKLSNLPEAGDLKIRFSRLIKTGSDTNTELLLTAFKTNLASDDVDDTVWNLDTAFQNIFSTYKRVEFEHKVTDLPNAGEIGGITVGGVPTSNWNRRGQTDNLNLRRLFLKQWLSLHSRPTGVLNSILIMRNGWQITPENTFKDTVSAKIYCFSRYSLDFQSGTINFSAFELLTTDANPGFELEVSIRKPTGTFRPVFNPEEEEGGTDGNVAGISNFNLVGDTSGDPSQNIVVASVIQNKSALDFSGNPESSTLSLNIVTNDLGAELQKTTALSLLSSWPDKTTPIAADKIPILDSVTGEIRMAAFPDEGGGGEVNTMTNLGLGAKVFANKVGVEFQLRSITTATPTNVTIIENTNDIEINVISYVHPLYTPRSIDTSGAEVIDIITSDGIGSITNITTRTLTLTDLGYIGATNANFYIHPAKQWVDKNDLTGATVISNLTIDSLGHPTNWVTRTLTAADVGAQSSLSNTITTGEVILYTNSGVSYLKRIVGSGILGVSTVPTSGMLDNGSIQIKLLQFGATVGQVLTWNGQQWSPSTIITSGEVNDGLNLGVVGAGVFASKSGVNLQFRRVLGSGGISVTEQTNTITVSASGLDNYQSWSLSVDGVSSPAITSGATVTLAANTGISITRAAGNLINFNVNEPQNIGTVFNLYKGINTTTNQFQFRGLSASGIIDLNFNDIGGGSNNNIVISALLASTRIYYGATGNTPTESSHIEVNTPLNGSDNNTVTFNLKPSTGGSMDGTGQTGLASVFLWGTNNFIYGAGNLTIRAGGTNLLMIGDASTRRLSFFGKTIGSTRQSVSGSTAEEKIDSLITILAEYGLLGPI